MRKLIGTLAVLAVVFYLCYQHYGTGWVARAIETSLGTQAAVKRIHIKLFPLELGVYGVRIKNLTGYKEPELASIPEVFVRIKPEALLQGKIQIETLKLNLEKVTAEKSVSGKINLKELLDQTKSKERASSGAEAPAEKKPEETPAEKPSLKVQIDAAEISIGQVDFADYGSAQRSIRSFPLHVDHLQLKNVTDGFSLAEQIIIEVLKRVGVSMMNIKFDELAKGLGQEADHLLTEAKSQLSKIFG